MFESAKKETEKNDIETIVKNHLRGFTRTIPSFLMVYGDRNTCLANFDKIIPDNVFQEVTGITLHDFIRLRDGADYDDELTGEIQHFDGHLFDEVVFNDAITEFMNRRDALRNYFKEEQGDISIFDYIPPQKTNQIFTPKKVVKEMCDLLEENEPGCFDDSTKTFIDPYMKSGLYIAEIVKRLFRSEKLKEEFPDEHERLFHIFKYQVYGLAPTEIIYHIATNFVLGFDEKMKLDETEHNLRYFDATPYAKDGTLEKALKKLYPELTC